MERFCASSRKHALPKTSVMTNWNNSNLGALCLMEALAKMLRAEVLPTHPPLVQIIANVCNEPALKQVDLYSKYTRLAAVVGGDWITVKEELLNATHFGAPALYCSISSMLTVFTCRRLRSHDELVSSFTELYKHISAGNEVLNKQVEHAITTIGKQMEQANKVEAVFTNFNDRVDIALTAIDKQMEHATITEARIANVVERADNAVTTVGKHEELVKRVEAVFTNFNDRVDIALTAIDKQMEHATITEARLANVVERADNAVNIVGKHEELVKRAEASMINITEKVDNAINIIGKQLEDTNKTETAILTDSSNKTPGARQHSQDVIDTPITFRCKYGNLSINEQYQCTFNGSSLEAKSLASWFTLPVPPADLRRLMNLDHEELIEMIKLNPTLMQEFKKLNLVKRKEFLDYFYAVIKRKTGQWY